VGVIIEKIKTIQEREMRSYLFVNVQIPLHNLFSRRIPTQQLIRRKHFLIFTYQPSIM
jgi:hypothetical protein